MNEPGAQVDDDRPSGVDPAGAARPGSHLRRSWRSRGRMPPARRARLAAHAVRLELPDPVAAAAWSPQALDIGFGYGESLLALAGAHPGQRVLGVDVHAPGLLRAMDALTAAGLDGGDVRILRADVAGLLPLLAPGSLQVIQAFHPDPWPKRRHHDRRLFDAATLRRCAALLAPGGRLHLATDHDGYAAAMRRAATEVGGLSRLPEPPPVPETRYGRRARAAGRTVASMAWRRTG